MAKKVAFKGTENKSYIEGMRQIRSSGASGAHDSRPRGERDRKGSKSAAIRYASY